MKLQELKPGTRCNEYQHAPVDCPHEVAFTDGDGDRCRGCGTFPDLCTCSAASVVRQIFGVPITRES